MTKAADVLNMLIPEGGWVTTGDLFEDIQFIEATPITKKQFDDGVASYGAWKTKQNADKAAIKAAAQAKLTALGLTVEDLQALGL